MFDHLGFSVADVDASVARYLQVFAPLGFREAKRIPIGVGDLVGLSGADGIPQFWLAPGGHDVEAVHHGF